MSNSTSDAPDLRDTWHVADYSETEIEILGEKELHVAFCSSSPLGRSFANEIVRAHNDQRVHQQSDGELRDSISFTALIQALERLRSKHKTPNQWYEGWNAAIDCLLHDAKARAHAPVDDERIRQIREWRAKQYGHSFTGTIGTDRAMADIDYLLALVDKKED